MTTQSTLDSTYPARQYTPADPIFYTIDNLMVNSLAVRDDFLASQIDVCVKSASPKLQEGVNGCMGIAQLVSGNVVVTNNTISGNSRIFLTSQQDGGTPGWLRVSNRVNGTSFTITSSNSSDTSTVAYIILTGS